MYGSSTSLCMQDLQPRIQPIEINKIAIRTKLSQFQVQIPFLNETDKNIYVEVFSVYDNGVIDSGADNDPNKGLASDAGDQFMLYCDNAKGYHRFNGNQTLLCALSNWDGDTNKQTYSMLNNHPFQVQKSDNLLNFIITKSAQNQDLYPNESEGQGIPLSQNKYLFNIVINIMQSESNY